MSPVRASAAALCLILVACGGDPATPPDGAGADPYRLSLPGGPALTVHPGDEQTLEVVLTRREEGPVGQAPIHFALEGDAAGSSLTAADVPTDDDGVASVRFIAGAQPAPLPVRVVASASGLPAEPVAFSIAVVPLRRLLKAVESAATRVSPGGASASTLATVSGTVALRVRETDLDTGEPIAGDTVTFTLPAVANARWSTGVDLAAMAQTGTGGQARAVLVTGSAAEGPWAVIAQPAGGGSPVTFTVTVQGGGSCTANAQCPQGQVCRGNPPRCQDAGACEACPPGDECIAGICRPPGGGECDPGAPACAPGQCCDPSALLCRDACAATCAPGTHCQAADACGMGACVPDEEVPDVSGWWSTRHDFAIAEALPTAVREIFKGLRLMDQTLLGKLRIPGLPQWVQVVLDSWVSRLLQQYLPGWLQELIHVSDDLGTVLGNLRSEGAMRLTREGDAAHLAGEEVWTSLVFYWLPLCNGNIAGDPGEPPECARIDVLTTDSGSADESAQCKGEVLPAISVKAAPFKATVVRRGEGHALIVEGRQVKLTMGKVILILVDQLIALVSGGEYRCIDEATDCRPGNSCLVDCEGLAEDIESATDGIVDSGTVGQLCGGAVRAMGEIWVLALAQAWPISADTLDFSGSAGIFGRTDGSACDEGSVPEACAARLGKASWDHDLNSNDAAVREGRDGSWEGDLFFRFAHRLPGAWRATRLE